MDDVQKLSPSLLLDGFRNLCVALGSATDPEERKWLLGKADKFEEEILRRVSW